jgi:hypothetical protein
MRIDPKGLNTRRRQVAQVWACQSVGLPCHASLINAGVSPYNKEWERHADAMPANICRIKATKEKAPEHGAAGAESLIVPHGSKPKGVNILTR